MTYCCCHVKQAIEVCYSATYNQIKPSKITFMATKPLALIYKENRTNKSLLPEPVPVNIEFSLQKHLRQPKLWTLYLQEYDATVRINWLDKL